MLTLFFGQERYQKEQDKLKEEWEKAQKEVEEEERRYYEEVRSSQGECVCVVLQSLAPPLCAAYACMWPCLTLDAQQCPISLFKRITLNGFQQTTVTHPHHVA